MANNNSGFNSLEIAVVGMACRFPGAENVEQFWQNLKNGVESVTLLTDEELKESRVSPDVFNAPNYVKAASMLKDVDLFDAGFFGYSPKEAAMLDPQHRLFLETAWHALENAGCDAQSFSGQIGVFAGTNFSSYLINNLLSNRKLQMNADGFFLQIANDKDNLATRTSYKLNLRGPSITLQTACSTSLVAVHYACQSLLNFESDLAIAGGVSVRVPQKAGYVYQDELIFSRDGHCRSFDADANGTVFGSGVGAVVLKRVEDAMKDGDDIIALIKGSAVNNDGSAKIGFTAPGRMGQEQVIKAALAMADVPVQTIGSIENHGTGTILGDPLEIEALTRVWSSQTTDRKVCPIGSVKSNVGHLECAAGIASFIKMCLSIKNKWLVPSVNFKNPNPHINFEKTPFYVNVESKQWKRNGTPLRGAVSSFGIGGTNAHVVLEEAPKKRDSGKSRPVQLLLLSAKTGAALEKTSHNILHYLKENESTNLADLAHTLRVGRTQFRHRRSIVCRTRKEAIEALESLDTGRTYTSCANEQTPKVVFMFPGQGSQYVGMGREIYDHEAVFRKEVDRCADLFKPLIGKDIRKVIFAGDDPAKAAARLNQTSMAQPALFAIEYALARLFLSWGIKPHAMIGHSLGEYVAACLSGVLRLEDAILVVAKRAQKMNEMPEGDMCVVNLSKEEVEQRLPKELSIAAVNGPSLTVVSGPPEEIRKFESVLAGRKARTTILHTSHAFHSTMMAPCAKSVLSLMKKVTFSAPRIPYLSNLTGKEITAARASDPQYWADHLVSPVQFGPGIKELREREQDLFFLEVGPGRTLSMLVKNTDVGLSTASSLPHHSEQDASSLAHLIGCLGKLWHKGVMPQWQEFSNGEVRNIVPLPVYPFERKRYWVEPAAPSGLVDETESILQSITVEEEKDDQPLTENSYVAPVTALEVQVAAIFSDVLGIEKVGLKNDFLDMGGHSLLATQLLDQLNKKLGTRIKLNEFFKEPTVSGLVKRIGTLESSADAGDSADDMPKAVADPENRHQPYPLREMQQAQWIGRLGNFSMSNVAAHVYFEAEKEGLDLERLHASWQSMIDRHETLREVILPEGGQQILQNPGPYRIKNADLRNEGSETIEKTLLEIRNEMDHVMRPTDQWPLFEVRTSQLPSNRTRIHFSIDLLICDVSSLRILLDEWAAAYDGKQLKQLELSFRDYVLAEQKIKQTKQFAASTAYWDDRIKTLPPAPALPLAKNPNEIIKPHFKRWSVRLDRERWDRFKTRAIEQRVSPSIALLTAFGYVLGIWSKNQCFSVNTTIINRITGIHPQASDIIGEFSSFAPLEVKIETDKSFLKTAGRVMEQNWKNLDNRHVSGVSILRKLAQSGGSTTGSVLPVVFTSTLVQEMDDKFSRVFGGFSHVISQTPQVWLDHTVLEDENGLVLSWHVVEGLFPEGMIDAMWSTYEKFVTKLAQEDGAWEECYQNLIPRKQLEERTKINSVEGEIPDSLLHAPFLEQARKNPDRIAVISGDKRLTYGQVTDYANRLGGVLCRSGLQAGEVVAIVMEKGWEQITSVMAILQAGGVYLAIDPHVPAERLAHLLESTAVKIVLSTDEHDQNLAWPASVSRVSVTDKLLTSLEPVVLNPTRKPDDLAYIIFTSGSTGLPKGVMVSHRSALNTIADMNRRFSINENDRVLCISELNFDLSVYDVFGLLSAGGALVLPSSKAGRDPQHWMNLVTEHRVTLWNSVPAFVEMFVEYAESRATNLPLRLVWMSGDWIPVSLPGRIKKFIPACSVVSLGGATEASIWSIIYVIDEVRPEWESIPYGKPLANQEFHVLNENFDPCPVHVPGELYIGGLGLAMGYWKDAEKTKKAYITHPKTGQRLYRTGDFGRYLPDGNIEFLGREDLQVKVSGFRIELGEIEAALAQHPQVRSAVVNLWEPAPGKKRIAGYYTPNEGVEADVGAIREFLSAKLPQYMIPNDFVEVKEFPLTANGKVDRKALPSPRQSKKSTAEKMETNYVVEKLAPIFARVLGVDTVDARENFFAMGGDSVTGIRIINEAAKEGIEITPQQLFEKQNIYDLAEVLNVAIPADETMETTAKQAGPVVFASYQHWFFKRHRYSLKYMNHAAQVKTMQVLKPELLESAFRHLVRFHDALQLHYVKKNEVWEQEYDELAGQAQLNIVDVTGLSAEDFAAAVADIRGQLEDAQDLSASPLLKLCLFQDRKNQVSHLLLIAHQLVMDYRSLPLFFEDLDAAYRQLAAGERVKAGKQPKFKAWADQQLQELETEEVREKVRQIQETLPVQVPALRLERPAARENQGTEHTVQIDESITRVLFDEALATYKTNVEEFLLIALVFAFRKGNVADALYVDWMVHPDRKYTEGRGFGRTIGVLDWATPLHLQLGAGSDLEENIRDIKDKLRLAYSGDNRQFLYSLGDPSGSAVPEIFFDYRAGMQPGAGIEMQWAATASARNFAGGSYALEIRAEITDGRLQVKWIFDNSRFAHDSIRELAEKFVDETNLLIENRNACRQTVLSASDFPDADVDQSELEKLLTLLN